jgi:hypothetical protein
VVGAVALAIGVPAGIAGCASSGDDGAKADGHNSTTIATTPPVKNIEPGQPVTAQTLAAVDPVLFYESVAKRQMTAPIERLRTSAFSPQEFASHDLQSISDIAIDHSNDKFYSVRSIFLGPDDDDPANLACLAGKEMHWSGKQWMQSKFGIMLCDQKPYLGGNDSVVSSGLTASQAEKVLATLRTYEGYVNVAKPTLLSSGGKTYVRQVVDFKPIVLTDDIYFGAAISMWSFREAGLDPATWPWSNTFGLLGGIHMVYYLDTSTLLPVAAFQRAIDTPAHNGKPAVKHTRIQVVNYSFPKTLPTPALGKSANTLSVSLPGGWKVQ